MPTQGQEPARSHRTFATRILLIAGVIAALAYGGYVIGKQAWATYHFRRARAELQLFHFAAAGSHLEKCRAAWPRDNETCLLAAQTARRDRRYEDAERLLQDYRRIGGVEEAIDLERSLARAQRGDLKRIEQGLWACVDRKLPESNFILEALAQGYEATFRLPQALRCLDLLLQMEPGHVPAHWQRGWLLDKLGDLKGALEEFEQVVALDTDHVEARLGLAELLIQRSRLEDATNQFREVLQRNPSEQRAWVGMARCMRKLDRVEEASRLLDSAIMLDPNDARVCAERARMAMLQEDLAKSEEWFRKALVFEPYDRESLYDLGLVLQKAGKKDEAREVQSRLQLLEDDTERSSTLLQELLKNPADAAANTELAEIMQRNGKPREAFSLLVSVLDSHPDHKPAHALLARHYQAAGDAQKAIQHRKMSQ